MFYDDVVVNGELFFKMSPTGEWRKATNKVLTARIAELSRGLQLAIEEAEGWYDDAHGGELQSDTLIEARKILGKGGLYERS